VLHTLAIAGYRSLRDFVIPLRGLNLVTGPNGSGKSNLYRALRLLAETAQGRVIPSLAREGGLQSTLWAGPESFSRAVLNGEHPVQGTPRQKVVSLRLGFCADDFGYAIDLGLPSDRPDSSATIPRSSVSASGPDRRCGRRRCSSIARDRW
jgi:predicted ATPase